MIVACFMTIALFSGANLIEAPGVNLVRAHCSSCHSERLVTQNRGTRDDWLRTIRWMQETQNLWAIPPDAEKAILDYLATHYPPGRAARRPPLHPSLMPRSLSKKSAELRPRVVPESTPLKSPKASQTSAGGCHCRAFAAEPKPGRAWVVLGLLLVLTAVRRRSHRHRR